MKDKLCPDCGARLGKGRFCPTCIAFREGKTADGAITPEPNANIRPNANVHVAPSSRAKAIEVRRNPVKLSVEEDGAIAVDCACGCGRKVYLKPAYFSSACRSRAWRKKHE